MLAAAYVPPPTSGQAEIDKAIARLNEGVASLPAGSCGPLVVLPLYASLPPEMQVGRRWGEAGFYCIFTEARGVL